jgi:hypothetical protein
MKDISKNIGLLVVLAVLIGFGGYYLGQSKILVPGGQAASAVSASDIANSLSVSGTGVPIGMARWECYFFFWGSYDSKTGWCKFTLKPMPTGLLSITALAPSTSGTSGGTTAADTTSGSSTHCLGYWCIAKTTIPDGSASAQKLATAQCVVMGGQVIDDQNVEPICAVTGNAMNQYVMGRFDTWEAAYQATPFGISNTAKLNASINSAIQNGAISGDMMSTTTGGNGPAGIAVVVATSPEGYTWVCKGIQGCWCENSSGNVCSGADAGRNVDEKSCLAKVQRIIRVTNTR